MNHRMKLSCLCACILALSANLFGGDNPADRTGTPPPASTTPAPLDPQIEALKKMLLDQQRQIDELRRQLAGEAKPATTPAAAAPKPAVVHTSSGEVASTTPIVPPSPVAAPAPI